MKYINMNWYKKARFITYDELRTGCVNKDLNNSEQLSQGISHEMEHTDNPEVAKKIALDHIKEDPQYYDKLEKAGL